MCTQDLLDEGGSMRNIKAIIEYDGTNYSGFQKQTKQNVLTIQETLESCLMRVLKEPIKIIGAGRTDAGVHAQGQVINFFTGCQIPLERLPLALNSKLPNDIVVKEVKEVKPDFHARKSARGKYYLYKIHNNFIPTAFYRNLMYCVPYEIDENMIRNGCRLFIGTHNFRGFCSSGTSIKSFERTIYTFELTRQGDLWEFHIKGNGFLYNMVRIIVGTLLELGRGKRDLASITAALEKGERHLAGQTAPPHGLYLQEVYY